MRALFTVRGHEVTEPMVWAVGSVLLVFTPVATLLMMPLVLLGAATESWLVPALVVGAVVAVLAGWAMVDPTWLSTRLFSFGLWVACVAGLLVGSSLLVEVGREVLPIDPLWFVLGLVWWMATIFVVSPALAWWAFVIGQRRAVARLTRVSPA